MWRTDVPTFDAIDEITGPLFNLAQKHGGEYDGWESIVVT
jgi:regulator of RNase E activity RraB